MTKLIWVLLTALLLSGTTLPAFAFSFSESEKKEAREEETRQAEAQKQIQQLLSVRCQSQLKQKTIAVILGKDHSSTNTDVLFQEVNARLNLLGMRTYSQKEITTRIAQAEMDAFLSNDMDAAATAASRLKADFILRGVIRSKTSINPVAKVKEVYISMVFTLVDNAGRIISNVSAQGESYSGNNTLAAALSLVREKSDLMVARLYNDYCSRSQKKKKAPVKDNPKPKVESVEDF